MDNIEQLLKHKTVYNISEVASGISGIGLILSIRRSRGIILTDIRTRISRPATCVLKSDLGKYQL